MYSFDNSEFKHDVNSNSKNYIVTLILLTLPGKKVSFGRLSFAVNVMLKLSNNNCSYTRKMYFREF